MLEDTTQTSDAISELASHGYASRLTTSAPGYSSLGWPSRVDGAARSEGAIAGSTTGRAPTKAVAERSAQF
jgi:hypothetical protein